MGMIIVVSNMFQIYKITQLDSRGIYGVVSDMQYHTWLLKHFVQDYK